MIGNLLQVLVLLGLLIVCFRYARHTEENLWLIFTALSFATLMLSTLYYLAHTYLREGMRVPFAANDIADFGSFLLFSTALRSALGLPRRGMAGVTAAAAIFAAANVCLWIGWSGEWVRDILGGLSFGWFLCVCIRSVYFTGALGRRGRAALWAVSAVLTALQTAIFFVPAALKGPMDWGATALMGAAELWLLMRILPALRPERSAEAALSLTFTGYCWNCVCMYMSAGIPYDVFANLMSLHLLLILLAVRKKVREA